MTTPTTENRPGSRDSSLSTPRQFKRHKVLPRPHNSGNADQNSQNQAKLDLVIDTSTSGSPSSQPPSPRTLKHQTKRIGSGPEPPPTPPIHPRNSSSSHSVLPPSPTVVDDPVQVTPTGTRRVTVTPPDQRSPPTPDVTPPQPVNRPRALRSMFPDGGVPSRSTTAESRTESFKTAREEPYASEDDDERSTVRDAIASGRTSQTTVRRTSESGNTRVPQPQALTQALAHINKAREGGQRSGTRGEGKTLDRDLSSSNGVEREWDDSLHRLVTVKKRRTAPETPASMNKTGGIYDDDMVTPTKATRAARQRLTDENRLPSKDGFDRRGVPSGPSNSTPSVKTDSRKVSSSSSKSTPSTVVEAFLIDGPPQRQRTLRHVRKQRELRPSIEIPNSPPRVTSTSSVPWHYLQQQHHDRLSGNQGRRHDSYASTTSNNSIASGRARREVWKNGGIPVVVIPDRKSSTRSRSSREPSLRSTSSRRSGRTMSLGSAPLNGPYNRDVSSEHTSRRSRAFSFSDGSDQRTMDYPPVVPARSSSLSAPTSRNTSRAGSMTADSIRARNALCPPAIVHSCVESGPGGTDTSTSEPERKATVSAAESPLIGVDRRLSSLDGAARKDLAAHDRLDVERHDENLSPKRLQARNTPFSIISLETNGTAPEVIQAHAVQMFPHQNSSVVIVNHSAKPSDGSDVPSILLNEVGAGEQPGANATETEADVPITPPQPQFTLDDVDSPLRNPRAPPEPPTGPPAFNLIPATPSGTTPAADKLAQLGNYFEATGEKPPRRPSLVRRALSRRRHSIDYPPSATTTRAPSLLTRTLSLTKRSQPDAVPAERRLPAMERGPAYPGSEGRPAEEHKLHPWWRPQWAGEECDDDCDHDQDGHGDSYYRFPLVDNRPHRPRRTMSERVKRTFAILPIRDDEFFPADSREGPERRTVQRTPSGNLRVIRLRESNESIARNRPRASRPQTAHDSQAKFSLWKGHSIRRRSSRENMRRFSLGSSLDEIQNIPRRMSERRRERRTQELRQKISGPKEVRDGVGDVVRNGMPRSQYRDGGYY